MMCRSVVPGCRAVLLLLVFGAGLARAQDAEDSDTLQTRVWDVDLVGKLNASQAGHKNWTEGGVNALASTASIRGEAKRRSPNWMHMYDFRTAIGIIRQDTLDLRKAEDILRLGSTISYRGDGFFRLFNPTISATARTQFAPGFNFEKNPLGTDQDPPIKVSDILSPAVFRESIGLTYNRPEWIRQRFGIAAKETVVLIERFRPLFGNAPDEAVRFQLGAESHTELDREIFKNVRFKSVLGLFAAFNQEELPDLLWENLIVMQINKWLSADFEIVTLFDRDISDALQIKEVLSIGLSVVFI